MQINAKDFSENSWEPWDFLEQFCSGTWPDEENTSNIEKKNQRQQKGDEKRTRYEVTKLATSAFSQERYLNFWRRGVGLQKGGSGRVKHNLFIAQEESPFQTRQTDYL